MGMQIYDRQASIDIVPNSLSLATELKVPMKSTATAVNYEERLTAPAHLEAIAQIARKQTRGSSVDWQDAMQAAQIKLIGSIRAGKFTYGTERDFARWATTVARFEIIDLVRKSKLRECDSTDRPLADNLTLLDTIVDRFNPFAALETADLVDRVKAAIIDLDKLYPDRSYYQLWLGKVNDRTQAEIAQKLGLTQSAISKRWQELIIRLTIELELAPAPSADRTRSDREW
jgi:RNA polymerase sigma factor (sigma-70 family)